MPENPDMDALFSMIRDLDNGDSSILDSSNNDYLARYLYDHQRFSDLKSLFIDPRWLHHRLEQSNYRYDGYSKDLDLVWKAAEVEAEQQIAANTEPRAIADIVRCLLIQTSVNSLAGTTAPELVARAVETGLWGLPRALDMARRVTDGETQAHFCLQMLRTGMLSPEQQDEMCHLCLQAARKIGYEQGRAEALSKLIPFVPDDMIGSILQVALDSEYDSTSAQILVVLAPRLNDDELERALQAALKMSPNVGDAPRVVCALVPYLPEERGRQIVKELLDEYSGAVDKDDLGREIEVMRELAPCLTGDLLEQALEEAQRFALEGGNEPLCALLPHLPEAERIRLAEAEIESVLSMSSEAYQFEYVDEWRFKGEEVAELAPFVPVERRGKLLAPFLQQALEIEDEKERVWLFCTLMPFLPQAQVARIARQTLRILQSLNSQSLNGWNRWEWECSDNLRSLAPYWPDALLGEALQVTQALRGEGYHTEALCALVPRLTGPLLQEVVQFALKENDTEKAAQFLISLVPQLEGEQRTQIVGHALPIAISMSYGKNRTNLLAALAPFLTRDILAQEASFSTPIKDEVAHLKAISALSMHLTEAQHIQVSERALEKTLKLNYIWEQADALKFLAQNAPEALLEQFLQATLAMRDYYDWTKVLAALAPRLPGALLERALQTVFDLEREHARVDALIALIPALQDRQLERVLQAALDLAQEGSRASILSALASGLTGSLLEAAWQATLAIKDEQSRANALRSIAPRIAREDFRRAVDGARTIKADRQRVQVFKALADYVTESSLEIALSFLLATDEEKERSQIMDNIASRFTRDQITQAAKRAQQKIKQLKDRQASQDAARSVFFVSIQLLNRVLKQPEDTVQPGSTPDFTEMQNDQGSANAGSQFAILSGSMLGQAWQSALDSNDYWLRGQALARLLPSIPGSAPLLKDIRTALLKALPSFKQLSRQDVLQALLSQELFAPPVLAVETLSAIIASIEDICEQWEWCAF